jgi:hypothetical protein
MEPYGNLSGNSGVTAYAEADSYIEVQFRGGRVYTYSYAHAGIEHVEQMKLLARAGKGLSTYISRHARNLYDP